MAGWNSIRFVPKSWNRRVTGRVMLTGLCTSTRAVNRALASHFELHPGDVIVALFYDTFSLLFGIRQLFADLFKMTLPFDHSLLRADHFTLRLPFQIILR